MNVPKLRFKEFDGEWEEKDFEELLEAKDGIRRGPFGSALKKEFFVPESDYVVYEQQNAIYDKYTTRYNITKDKYEELIKFSLNAGDFIMSGAGTIGRISKVPKGIKKGVFNQALIRFRINSEITDSEYFLQFMRAEKMQRNLTGANPGSAITNLVPMSELKKWSIITPNIKEQQKISAFLNLLDKKIQLQQQKIDLLQEQKKGYMQKIFNQELRFEDGNVQDYQEWISEKLYHIAEINKGTQLNKNLLSKIRTTEQIYPVYNGGISPSGFTSVNNRVKDNIIISEGGNSCGYVNYIKEDFYSGGHSYTILLKNNEINKKFLYYYLKYKENHIMALRVGSGLPNIQKSALSNFDIHYPNISEQLRITEFLSIFEKKIQYEEIKVSKLIEQKKGFMQQMFM